MLTLSAKSVYGLTALLELARRYNTEPVQIRDMANRRNIPQHYLEQLLVALRRAGIVESYRGAQGGYALSKHPGKIKVSEVLEALDGPIEIVAEKHKNSHLSFFWDDIETKMAHLFSLSLEELELARQRSTGQFMYNI